MSDATSLLLWRVFGKWGNINIRYYFLVKKRAPSCVVTARGRVNTEFCLSCVVAALNSAVCLFFSRQKNVGRVHSSHKLRRELRKSTGAHNATLSTPTLANVPSTPSAPCRGISPKLSASPRASGLSSASAKRSYRSLLIRLRPGEMGAVRVQDGVGLAVWVVGFALEVRPNPWRFSVVLALASVRSRPFHIVF